MAEVTERLAHALPGRVSVLCARAPYRAFVEAARALFQDALHPSSLFEAHGVAAGALCTRARAWRAG